MSNRIEDLRFNLSTLEDSDGAFRDLALAMKRVAVLDAKLDHKIAELKASHENRIAEDRSIVEYQRMELAKFIDAHRDLFVKPRTRKTEQGEYGLRTVSEVKILNEETLLESLQELGYLDCIEVKRTPIKPALKARLLDGELIPGVFINSGDTAVCKVAKSFLEVPPDDLQS